MNFDEIDYDENSELLYHLAQQAYDAVAQNISDEEDIPQVINQFKVVRSASKVFIKNVIFL